MPRSPNWKRPRISNEAQRRYTKLRKTLLTFPRAGCSALQPSASNAALAQRFPGPPAPDGLAGPLRLGGPPGPRTADLPRPPGVEGRNPGYMAVRETLSAAPGPLPTATLESTAAPLTTAFMARRLAIMAMAPQVMPTGFGDNATGRPDGVHIYSNSSSSDITAASTAAG